MLGKRSSFPSGSPRSFAARPWWTVAGAGISASFAFEVAQYLLAVGSSDITDVVLDTAAALPGSTCAIAISAAASLRDGRLRVSDAAEPPSACAGTPGAATVWRPPR